MGCLTKIRFMIAKLSFATKACLYERYFYVDIKKPRFTRRGFFSFY